MSVTLWVKKYRPKTLNDYVWKNESHRKKAEEWIKEGALPHLLFGGVQGTGKTSLAELLLSELKIPDGDILRINASNENNVETVRKKIINFVSTWSLGETGIKYVLLDEADRMSHSAQDILRGEMEKYIESCRFILTGNHPNKIIPAIHSRCQTIFFREIDQDDFVARVGEILVNENIKFDVDDLLSYVRASYPDLRKCINMVQQHCYNGSLQSPETLEDSDGTKDWLLQAVVLFKEKKFLEARKLIVNQAQADEYTDVFRFLYKNLDLWGNNQDIQDEALLIIRKGLVNHSLVADPEINLSATLVELTQLSK